MTTSPFTGAPTQTTPHAEPRSTISATDDRPSAQTEANPASSTNAPSSQPVNPLQQLLLNMRAHSDRLHESNDPSARAEYSRQLASAAAFFRTLSLDMASRANLVAPIMRLPKEVLVAILGIASGAEPPRPPQLAFVPGAGARMAVVNGQLGWVRFAHVCRRWRIILLSMHFLWARHVGVLPKALLAFLERAGSVQPLSFTTHLHKELRVPSLKYILLQLPIERIRLMRLDLNKLDDLYATYHSLMNPNNPLPVLEIIKISAAVHSDFATTAMIHQAPKVLPNLRVLELEHFFLPFIAPNLTRLLLQGFSIAWKTVLDALTAFPSLSQFKILECSFESQPATAKPPLRSLELLVIEDCGTTDGGDIYDLFETQVCLPATTRISVAHYGSSSSTDSADMLPQLHTWFSAIRLCTRSLTRAEHPPNILSFTEEDMQVLSYDEPPNIRDPVWQEPYLQGAIAHARLETDDGIQCAWKAATLATFNFQAITVLVIVDCYYLIWDDIYRLLPNVHTLRVQAGNSDAFEPLGRCQDIDNNQAGSSPPQTLPLARLAVLWVDDDVYRADGERENEEAIRKALLDTLRGRSDLCAQLGLSNALRTLYLQSYKDLKDGDEYMQVLRTVVPTVECFDTQNVHPESWNSSLRFHHLPSSLELLPLVY